MKKRSLIRGRLVLASAILVLAAGAVMAAVAAGTPAASVVLEYKMKPGQVLRYQGTEDGREIVDMMGQIVESTTSSSSKFTFQTKDRQDKNFILGVTIDEMTISVNSIQGDMSPDMTPVLGKSFDLTLSPLGIELDASGAEAITYESPNGTSNISAGFKVFFPDLPGKAVKVGDSWPSTFVIEEKTSAVDIRIDGKSVNTLEGFETVDGMECARVVAKSTGTITGTGSQQGQELQFSGTLTGTDTWYFAVKEGLFVKMTGESTSDMSVDVAGMSLPVTGTRTNEIKLIGK
jgi:hypothetical protein